MRSPLAALRALSGRIVIAILVCALLMGAAVFQINRYIDNEVAKIPRVQVATAPTASGSATNFLIIGSETRSFVQSQSDKQAVTDANTTADGPQQSHTMMVLRTGRTARCRSRDLYVNIPGARQRQARAAFNEGPQRSSTR